jgi:pimeloyl-ACP methyl ester carboxylesterase
MTRRILAVALVALLLVASRGLAEDKFFDSAGVKIHYIVEGKGEPVVLIHGFTANIQMQWAAPGILSKLKNDYQVIALDNRGHGKSGKPHDPKQYGAEMVNDVIRLMDHLKVPKAHVAGYSMGGFMTNYLIAHHSDRVITATLGGAGWRKPNDNTNDLLTRLAEALESGKGITPLIEALTPAGRPKPDAQQLEFINQMVMTMNDTKALAACIRGLTGLSVTESQLKANKVPTLALIGSDDPLKVGVDEMAPLMPNLKVEVIDNTDHMTAFASPEFIGGLKGFLEGHSTEPAAAAAGGNGGK